jgi:hypothetical protein
MRLSLVPPFDYGSEGWGFEFLQAHSRNTNASNTIGHCHSTVAFLVFAASVPPCHS